MCKLLLTFAFLFVFFSCVSAQNSGANDPDSLPKPAKSTLRARVYYEDTGRPVKRMSVMLISKARSREATGVTDANGNLEIKNLQAGKYYALVNAPGVVTPLAYVDFRRPREESFEDQMLGFPAIEINGISDITAQIPARRGAAIGGRVTYSDGDAAIGIKIEILRKVGDEYLQTVPNFPAIESMVRGDAGIFQTDDRGMYRFSGLPAGEYLVKVTENVQHTSEPRQNYYGSDSHLHGDGSLLSVFFENAFLKDNAQTLKVEFGQELTEINITIPDRDLHSIEGKIIAAKDKLPIRNAKLYIKRDGDTEITSGPFSNQPQSVHSDINGVWKFSELPKGTYKIYTEAEDSDFDEVARAYGRDPSASHNAANVASYNTGRKGEKPSPPKFAKTVKEFTVEDTDLSGQLVELEFGGTLTGTVSIEDSKDDPGSVFIVAYNEKSDSASSTSVSFYDYTANGRVIVKSREFRLEAISSGENSIQITASDQDYYVKSAESNQLDLLKGPIEIKSGETLANIKVVLSNDTGTLKGTVFDDEKQPVAGYELWLVPTDPTKQKTSNFYRTVKTNEKGEFEIKLPPLEYAALSVPSKKDAKNRKDYYAWLSNAVKSVQAFMIGAGKITRASIKGARTTSQ